MGQKLSNSSSYETKSFPKIVTGLNKKCSNLWDYLKFKPDKITYGPVTLFVTINSHLSFYFINFGPFWRNISFWPEKRMCRTCDLKNLGTLANSTLGCQHIKNCLWPMAVFYVSLPQICYPSYCTKSPTGVDWSQTDLINDEDISEILISFGWFFWNENLVNFRC